eukprot:COSAG02_NODE_514_length_20825_cov_5.990495_7_plen_159_part_00
MRTSPSAASITLGTELAIQSGAQPILGGGGSWSQWNATKIWVWLDLFWLIGIMTLFGNWTLSTLGARNNIVSAVVRPTVAGNQPREPQSQPTEKPKAQVEAEKFTRGAHLARLVLRCWVGWGPQRAWGLPPPQMSRESEELERRLGLGVQLTRGTTLL